MSFQGQQLLRMSDNSRMLKSIQSSKMENIFLHKEEEQQESKIFFHTGSKQKQNEYSPGKLKIKQELNQIDFQLKSVKNKKINITKWDSFAPYSFIKLSSQEKDYVFQNLFQDFKTMKVQHNDYVQKYVKLFAKLQKLEIQISKFKKKDGVTAAQKTQIYKEQNSQNSQMKEQIKRLHQKIMALTSGNVKPVAKPKSSHNKTFSNTQKSIFPVNQNLKAQLQLQKRHVKQLLQVIDDLKRNKMSLESELKQRNFSKNIQNINLKPGFTKGVRNNGLDSESRFKQYANQLQMWKQKYHQMQLCYNKMNEDKDRVIKQLNQELIQLRQNERMKKNLQRSINRPAFNIYGNQDRIRQLEEINQRLQRQLKDLARNPLFKDNTQSLELKKKNAELQSKVQKLSQQLNQVKEQKMKYFSQLQFKSKQSSLLKAEGQKFKRQLKDYAEQSIKQSNKNANQPYKYDQNDYYRKLMNLVKLEGEDPVWKKYADMSSPVFSVMAQSQLREMVQRLWYSKLELLAHLQKAQIQLKMYKQTNEDRVNGSIRERQSLEQELRVTRARLDEWMCMDRVNGNKRDFKVFESKGIKYNDSISVFQDDQDQIKALDHNENFFDLYLGQLSLDQSNVLRHPKNKIKSASNIISFVTLDFYNHATQHSNFSEGLSKKLLNNFSFKVQINTYFIKFLSKNSISLELWSPQGTSTILLGKGQIWLTDLLNSTAKDVSNIVRGKCPMYSTNKSLIGTVQYRIRLRLPITPYLQFNNSKQLIPKSALRNDPFAVNQRKKLSITIQRAEGLSSRSNTFVYFSIQNQDFFTEPEMGSSPYWDYHRQVDVVVDSEFSSYIKQNYVQFTLFDDDKQVNEDVIGIAKANLTSLLQNSKPLDLELDVQDNSFQKVGKLKLKINWV